MAIVKDRDMCEYQTELLKTHNMHSANCSVNQDLLAAYSISGQALG